MKCMRMILIAVLMAGAAPALAQRPEAPAPPVVRGDRPNLERLHELRLERLKETLQLTDQQVAALSRSMEQMAQAMRQSHESERTQLERLRDELRSQPVNEAGLRTTLQAIERERETIARLHREHIEQLKRELTVEQQAKFLLFGHQFNHRLRELMSERGHGMQMRRGKPGKAPGHPGMPGHPRGPRPDRAPNAPAPAAPPQGS